MIARRAITALLLVIALASSASALDVRVKEVRRGSSSVATTIELRDVLPDRFKKTLDSGGVLHLRLQAELWESRPVWDRLVYPAIVRVLRFHRTQPSGAMSITDAAGAATTYAVVAGSIPLALDLGEASRITPAERYYVHIIATLGTLADREVDEVGDALFGRPSEANGIGSLGRLVFRTALQVSDYLQSVSAETRGRKIAGVDILKP